MSSQTGFKGSHADVQVICMVPVWCQCKGCIPVLQCEYRIFASENVITWSVKAKPGPFAVPFSLSLPL